MQTMTEHTIKQYSIELEDLRSKVLRMGGLVETQITKALNGLQTGNMSLLDEVIENDRRVNILQLELDNDCNQIVAKRQPAAMDLRLVMSVIRSAADLERMGDEAKKIAKSAKRLHADDFNFVPRIDLSQSSQTALSMLRTALDAFARSDAGSYAGIRALDAEVDRSFKAITRQLVTYMMEDPRTISRSLEMMFIAKAIERIGDHAKNVAEYVVFLAEGEDVRYAKAQAAQDGGA